MLLRQWLSNPTPSDRSLSPWRRRLIVTAAIVAAGSFLWSQLPKGSYPTDLSRIGQGQAALVLAIDSNYSGGASVMELLNDVRHDFADSVQFLVASLALPNGQAFADQHQASDGMVLLFDAKGQRIAVLCAPRTQDELRKAAAASRWGFDSQAHRAGQAGRDLMMGSLP